MKDLNMKTLTVERIIGDIAVIENEDLSHYDIPVANLPDNVKEGTVLDFDGENYYINSDEEALRKRRILEKQKILFNKSKKD